MENKFYKRKLAPRLKDFDYSSDGAYFVTICTKDRENFFGIIRNDKTFLNQCGEIIRQKWLWLTQQYPYVRLDEFVVMPNHFHGILIIDSFSHGRDRSRPVSTNERPTSIKPNKIKPLPELIGAFKTTSSKQMHKSIRSDFQWQRSFYDHIIRDEDELNRIRDYIKLNPVNWNKDKFHPDL
jgi:REP element-mobilizing transposase RayT